MNKKEREELCLGWAVEASKQQTGRSKKILKYLACEEYPRDESERPDFVKLIQSGGKDNKGFMLGIEHFRVDHYSIEKHDGKVASTGARQEKTARDIYDKWHNENFIDESIGEITQDLEGIIIQEYQNRGEATYPTLIKSYEYSFSKHLENVDIYRKNLERICASKYQYKFCFLIEIRNQFTQLYYNDKKGTYLSKNGIGPLFDDYIQFIEKHVDPCKVDYIIFCITELLDTKERIVIALETREIRKKINRAHIPIYHYIGTDFILPPFQGINREINMKSKIEFQKDSFTYSIKGTYKSIDEQGKFDLRMYCVYLMSILSKSKIPFVTDPFVQRYYEALAEFIIGWKKPEDARENWVIHPVLKDISIDDINRRFDLFDEKWGYKKSDEQKIC